MVLKLAVVVVHLHLLLGTDYDHLPVLFSMQLFSAFYFKVSRYFYSILLLQLDSRNFFAKTFAF